MQSNFSTDTNFFDYNSLYGNNADAYGGMASWGNTPAAGATGAINTSQFMSPQMLANYAAPTGIADKLRDFNSQYGSTITGGLQAAAGLWGAYNGMQQTKLAKQQMANSLNQWNKSYANQVSSYNTRLEDRQNARVAAQGANQQDTASYMAKNRLK